MEPPPRPIRALGGPAPGRGRAAADRVGPARRPPRQFLRFRAEGVTVRYGAQEALSEVSVSFEPGRIHALLGENGAGKTTLANAMAGLVAPCSGRIVREGRVGFVHQHFAIPPGLSSAECLVLEEARPRWWSRRALAAHFDAVARATGLDLGDPFAPAHLLPVGARQRLELARALSRRPDLLLLDEPTAVLAPTEVASFASSVRALARAGAAVVFITHRLPEVFEIADVLSVLRRGRLLRTAPVSEASPVEVAAEIFEAAPVPPRLREREAGREVVRLEDVASASGGASALRGVTLSARAGEIVGIVGVDGNGQDELARAVAGLSPVAQGRLLVQDRPASIRTMRERGGAVIPGDRGREGLILDFSARENLRLVEPVRPLPAEAARSLLERFGVRPPEPDRPARTLSGGNQQKVVLARELSREPDFVLAVSPTRGLDIASASATLAALDGAARRGAAVLLVTSDLDEARAIADRLHVIYRGRLSRGFAPDAPASDLGAAMTGVGSPG